MAKRSNSNLHVAKADKKDEFYTHYDVIADEMRYYPDAFRGKTVLCNCDDPLESNFTKYFILNFRRLGLKKLICTFYDINGGSAYAFEYEGQDMNDDGVINEKDIEFIRQSGACRTVLVDDEGFDKEHAEECWAMGIYGSGDFRSKNCIMYLKEADIVVTNPPFSFFREYIGQLFEYKKSFIIIGNQNAITYKEIFPYIKENKLWLGVSMNGSNRWFYVPDDYEPKENAAGFKIENGRKMLFVNGVVWFTNVPHKKRNTPLDLYKVYSPENYPKYDNYDAIEVSKVELLPCDYDGVMGVPITFLHKYCPEQFEIVGSTQRGCHDEFPDTKKYNDYWEVRSKDGVKTGSSGVKTNENAVLKGVGGKKHYFTNKEGDIVHSEYGRIFVKKK